MHNKAKPGTQKSHYICLTCIQPLSLSELSIINDEDEDQLEEEQEE
jgi:hypothetical protein